MKAQKNNKSKTKTAGKPNKGSTVSEDNNFDVMQWQNYVFQLVWKDKTIEYVTEGYLPFKYITAAFEDLINQKDILGKVNKRITILSQSAPVEDQIE